jgi:DDE superfamily endonuclease
MASGGPYITECICADGTSIPPLIIFRRKSMQHQYIPSNRPTDWSLSYNTKGWTSNEHGVQWLRQCFEQTREKADGAPRLLICDGHDSHITGQFIGHCMDNNIHLMILPPHSSHLTQPLDVGVFGPLKKVMAAKIDPLLQTGVANVQKWEWLEAFIKAHQQVFNPQNILGGFRGAGIVPFAPRKVLKRVSSAATPPPQKRFITPPPITPFPDSVLTSSPIDMNAVRFANSALNTVVANNSSIPTPARKYIKSLTRTNERLYASKTIIQREKEEISEALAARRARLSGKRRVISGQHLLTTVEIFTGVIEAEETTRKRKAPGPKKPRKRRSKATAVSSDESGDDLESESSGGVEVMDSIDS